MKEYYEYANYRKLPVDVPGLSPEMAEDLEKRIQEFEDKHQTDVLNGKDGYVPKLTRFDICLGVSVNAALLLYYAITLIVDSFG